MSKAKPYAIDETHDPDRTSWVDSANGHADFPIQNLPFGMFSSDGGQPRAGVAIGDAILDLAAFVSEGLASTELAPALAGTSLNTLLGLPSASRRDLRRRLSDCLSDRRYQPRLATLLTDSGSCRLHLPAVIGGYTDFYVGIHHAMNVGKQFRPDNPLLPNYKHVPIGYHGRSSSIRPSGTPVVRPNGQRRQSDRDLPEFGPSRRLDYELELGVWIGAGNVLGEPIPIREAAEHIAGLCLLNDWSARDLQAWEYQPLGPFLAKNFHSTVSPWIVTMEALAPFRIAQAPRDAADPRPLHYLWNDDDQRSGAFAINLEAALLTEQMRRNGAAPFALSRGPASSMYWTVAQMVTHHASNGCDLNPGDLLGTGTISGPAKSSYGSLLEISVGGKEPIALPTGERRTFLEDGDEIIFRAKAAAEGFVSIGFGACRGTIVPAPPIAP